ncbi:hypothetical protein V2K54_10815 [Pseudomonas alliivorans]|nr:hypothetical protein [Pseudomonas alliivorans]MEE4956199.1 hypothetical protein [Pseudomonas alliivorans]MEE4965848.1 hypothetical protein [Pseudomonas alliivorans]MEE4986956.1 hypothetical protein [Pseudomonas alliivorans]MEE4991619.1 hypothetical protein [Pseudomonas alliivorans]
MYLITLAEELDTLVKRDSAHISESEDSVTASNLSAEAAREILSVCSELGLESFAFDEEQTPTEQCDLVADFEPFRVTIRKPDSNPDALDILTSVGLKNWLEKGHSSSIWRIATLSKPLFTQGRIYTGWIRPQEEGDLHAKEDVVISPSTKSPRALVRVSGLLNRVPVDVRPWLLIDPSQFDREEPFHRLWSANAFDALIHTLANEVDPERHSLIFKGPPKLSLETTGVSLEQNAQVDAITFLAVQAAASWVYENSREAEIRHSLLATEIARSGRENGPALEYLKANISTALESAKIAYQMSLSELGKETLKSLGDLRKAITEETAKATDATRQTITGVAWALAVGVGLVAARLGTGIDPWLASMVMLIATAYIGMIVYSGWSFVSLQRDLRDDWQPKLYRFLPAEEYKKMVKDPADRSEKVFRNSAVVGVFAVVLMFIGVTIVSFSSDPGSQVGKLAPKVSGANADVVIKLNQQLEKLNLPIYNPVPLRKDWSSLPVPPPKSNVEPAKQ